MKAQFHSMGVNEARLGLSLLTILSVVFGYVALQRLGMTGDAPPVEIVRPSDTTPPATAIIPPNDPALRVLRPQTSDAPDVERMSRRPDWDFPAGADSRSEFDLDGRDSLWPGGLDGSGERGRVPPTAPRQRTQ